MKLLRIAGVLGLIALTWGPPLHAVPPSFEWSDDATGATCEYFTGMGRLAWSRRGGDWVDARGRAYGDRALDTRQVPVASGRTLVQWNVTGLVRDWLKGASRNDGLMLRAEAGELGGVIDFHSRESKDAAARPFLELEWSDGSLDRLAPVVDTHLDCSTYKSQGAQSTLQVSANKSALLRFALPKSPARLVRAALVLASDKQYGNGAQVGLFQIAPPYARASPPAVPGLAARFPRDVGLDSHPDVIFATGFERPVWNAEWSPYSALSTVEITASDPVRKFKPFQGSALRVPIVKGSNYGLDLRFLLARKGSPEPEEIYFRYYLRFGDDWNPSLDGGKLPGIAGTYGRAGWGKRKSDGYNGWSVRGGFAARPTAEKSIANLTAIGSYVYHVDGQDDSGDYWGWNQGPAGLLENNQWYAIEQYVKLNSPGHSDGVIRAWVDGLQVFEKAGLRFRQVPSLKIESIWLNVYHGGASVAPHDMTLYIDNLVIAKNYIGPVQP